MGSQNWPSPYPQASCFPILTARINLFNRRGSSSSSSRVWLAISNRIYWKDVNEDKSWAPNSLYDFRGSSSLKISRLACDEDWKSVEESGSESEQDQRLSVLVRGTLRGPARLLRIRENVQVLLTFDSIDVRKWFVNELLVRMAPQGFLHDRLVEQVSSIERTPLSNEDKGEVDILRVEGGIVTSRSSSSNSPPHTCGDFLELRNDLSQIEAGIKNMDFTSNLYAQGAKITGGIGTVVKSKAKNLVENTELVNQANLVAETAQRVSSITGALSGLSSIFRLIGLGTRFIVKLADANHGSQNLPILLGEVVLYLNILTKMFTDILTTSNVEHILVSNAVETLTNTIDTIGEIEDYLMHGKVGRVIQSKLVDELKSKVGELSTSVVTCVHSARLLKRRLEREIDSKSNIGQFDPVPMLSQYFVGRSKELENLAKIVNVYGSAAITQFGGAGKTQLMVKFSENFERNDSVPGGGVYWVTAEGNEEQVLESLATFVEKLQNYTMTMEDRRKPEMVAFALRRALSTLNAKWLLCLDNVDSADDPGVSKILDMVCSIANPAEKNGWVVVTSRQGRETLWDGMKKEQRLELKPLSLDDSMCLLWRFVHSVCESDADDKTVIADMYRYKEINRAEFNALMELGALNGTHGLGGLPLALVQAGTYMRRFECSFSDYLKRYKEADGKAEVELLLEKSREFAPVRAEQRAILTTWKISVERLSSDALEVLRVLSLFGNAPMSKKLVKKVLKRASCQETSVFLKELMLLKKELVHGSSLIQQENRNTFQMHRLVRLFVLVDMERGSSAWKTTFCLAVASSHDHMKKVLQQAGKSFKDDPDSFRDVQLLSLPHVFSIVNHFSRSEISPEVTQQTELCHLHGFATRSLKWLGRFQDALIVSQSQLKLFCVIHGEHAAHPTKAAVLKDLSALHRDHGNLDEALTFGINSLNMLYVIYGDGAIHSSIAIVASDVSLIFKDQGNLDKALMWARLSLDMELSIVGADAANSSVSASYTNLSSIYQDMGVDKVALSTAQKGLEIKFAIHGDDANHREIAVDLNNISTMHQRLGNLNDALETAWKCLRMRRAVYGDDVNHPEVVTSLMKISMIYRDQGNLNEASSMARKSLEMALAIYGDNAVHPTVAKILSNVAEVSRDQGNLDEAVEMAQKSLNMELVIFGDDVPHPSIATSYNNLSLLYRDQGNFDEAITMARKCLDIELAVHGYNANHHSIATTFNNLSSLYQELGNYDEAVELAQKALNMQRAILGDDVNHPLIAALFSNLSYSYHGQGNLEDAIEMGENSLQMKNAIYGEDSNHLSIAVSLNNLSRLYAEKGNHDHAIYFGRKCIEILRSVNSNHPQIDKTSAFIDEQLRVQGTKSK